MLVTLIPQGREKGLSRRSLRINSAKNPGPASWDEIEQIQRSFVVPMK